MSATSRRNFMSLSRLGAALLLLAGVAACGDGGTPTSQAPTAAQSTEQAVDEPAGSSDSPSSSGGQRISIGEDEALIWGDGAYGVLLAHGAAFDAASWNDQAIKIAERHATALAVENISGDGLLAAVDYLREERGMTQIVFVGGSKGADAMLQLLADQPALADQIILLSPNHVVQGLGDEPKLFIASQDEPVADVSTQLAANAPGDDNDVVLLPGSAHAQNIFGTDQGPRAMRLILERLTQFADT